MRPVSATFCTFTPALIHLLESQYGLLGSRRVLELLAADIQHLVEQFYPPAERLSSTWMVFTGTRASGGKAHPGQRAGEHELVTLAWPVLLPEDLATWSSIRIPRRLARRGVERQLVRLIEYGANHPQGPVLLSEADLAALLGTRRAQISRLLLRAREKTGKPLPTKGYYFDQGMRPTHKDEIIALYEAGVDEAEIARRSAHAPESVGRYLRDYARVKLLLAHGTPVEQISVLVDMQPSVARVYAKWLQNIIPIYSTGRRRSRKARRGKKVPNVTICVRTASPAP